jgi:hypothetical protein
MSAHASFIRFCCDATEELAEAERCEWINCRMRWKGFTSGRRASRKPGPPLRSAKPAGHSPFFAPAADRVYPLAFDESGDPLQKLPLDEAEPRVSER